MSTVAADREVSHSRCPCSISYLCPILSVCIILPSCTLAPLKFCGPCVKTRTLTVSSVNGIDSAPEASDLSPSLSLSFFLSVFQISRGEEKLDQFGLPILSRQLSCAWERGEESHMIGIWHFLLQPCSWKVGEELLEILSNRMRSV